MSTNTYMAVPQASQGAMNPCREPDMSVLELAGFDGPEGDTSTRPWRPLTRPRQEAWVRPAVGAQSVRAVRDQELEDPPVPERWEARDTVSQPQETGVDGHHQIPVNRSRSPPVLASDPATQIGNSREPRIQYESSIGRIPLPDRLGRGGTSHQQANQGGFPHEPSRMNQTYRTRTEPHFIPRANPQPAPQARKYLHGPSSVGIPLPGVLEPVTVNLVQRSDPWRGGRDPVSVKPSTESLVRHIWAPACRPNHPRCMSGGPPMGQGNWPRHRCLPTIIGTSQASGLLFGDNHLQTGSR